MVGTPIEEMELILDRVHTQVDVSDIKDLTYFFSKETTRDIGKVSSAKARLIRVLNEPSAVEEEIKKARTFTQLKEAEDLINRIVLTAQISRVEEEFERRKAEIVEFLREKRRISFEGKQLVLAGEVEAAEELLGRRLTASEQAMAILGRSASIDELWRMSKEGIIKEIR